MTRPPAYHVKGDTYAVCRNRRDLLEADVAAYNKAHPYGTRETAGDDARPLATRLRVTPRARFIMDRAVAAYESRRGLERGTVWRTVPCTACGLGMRIRRDRATTDPPVHGACRAVKIRVSAHDVRTVLAELAGLRQLAHRWDRTNGGGGGYTPGVANRDAVTRLSAAAGPWAQ